MKTISVRLPDQYLQEIEEACKQEVLDKGTMIRKLIGDALREYHIKKAFDLYAEGKISLWKAASMAGLTYRGALEEIKRRNIPFRYDREDLNSDIKWALTEE
jgi:predicted HTH domain antitoxin